MFRVFLCLSAPEMHRGCTGNAGLDGILSMGKPHGGFFCAGLQVAH